MLESGLDESGKMDPRLRQQIADSMATLLARLLQREVVVTDETKLMEELGLSSSLALELLLELEEQLEIQINVEELDEGEMQTVGDLADFIATNSTPA